MKEVAVYRKLGLSVIPLRADKRPWLESWKVYQTRHPTDEECAAWWGLAPGVGLVTGTISGVVVLDIDPRHGGIESIRALLSEGFSIPKGPVCDTGGGGHHLYFRATGKVAMRPGFRPGLDLKAEGGYVVAPPSPHPSGKFYQWRGGRGLEVPLPPCPPWLVNPTAPATPSRLMVPERIATGARNDTMFRLASSMRAKGCERVEILAALEVLNRRCDPPLPPHNLETIAGSVNRYPSPAVTSAAYAGIPYHGETGL